MEEIEELEYTSDDIEARPHRRRIIVRRAPRIPRRAYPKQTKVIGGEEATLKEMTVREVSLFNQDYDNLIASYSDNDVRSRAIKGLLIKNRRLVFDAVRAIAFKAKTNYGGANTLGNTLGIALVRPKDVLGQEKWDVSYSSEGVKDFWDSTTNPGSPMKMSDSSGVVILGLMDDVTEPKNNYISWKKNGKDFAGRTLEWAYTDAKVMPEPMPIVVLPLQTIYASVYANATGIDRLIPVAVKVTTGDRLRDPTIGHLE